MSDNQMASVPTGSSPSQSAGSLLLGRIETETSAESKETSGDEGELHTEMDAWGIGGDKLTSVQKKGHVSKQKSEIDHYHMNHRNRGYAVIINNENFHWTTGMNKRTGTDIDARNLKRVFKKLGFKVFEHKDTTCIVLHEVIRAMAKANHKGNDCFVCAILSHGDDGCVYGIDGTIKITTLVNQFRGDLCPTLAGKPKIFIFQACRGTKHEIPVPPAKDVRDSTDSTPVHTVEVDAAPSPTLPSGCDFLFCYSVVEGFYSHRDTLYGSWFVQDFTWVMESMVLKDGEDHEPVDFLDILTAVNKKVSERSVERALSRSFIGKKQMPCFLSMLTKKLYLMRQCKSDR